MGRYVRVLGAVACACALAVGGARAPAAGDEEPSPSISFEHASLPLDARLWSVAVGDVTGDGWNEILATSGDGTDELASSLFLVRSRADRSLPPPVRYDLSGKDVCCNARQMGIAIGDLTGDGGNEVVVATARGVDVFGWDGADLVRSATLQVSGIPQHLRTLDMDGDGLVDIVLRAGDRGDVDGGVFVLRNTPGGFVERRALTYPHHWQGALEVADLDGDGRPDVLLGSKELLVGLQRSDGSFSVRADEAGNAVRGLAVADLTGSGHPDVAVTSGGNSPTFFELFENDGTGRLGDPVEHETYQMPASVKAGDLNGTGRADLVVMHSGGYSAVGTYEQRAEGLMEEVLFRLPERNSTHHWSDAMAIGDVDGDGRPDVVFVDRNRIVVLSNTTDYEPPAEARAPERSEELVVDRLDGPSRFETAVAVSRDSFASGVQRAYLATGADFPDALGAAAPAAAFAGPVLLTATDRLPAVVAEELRRLSPGEIVIAGGEAVVSPAVEEEAASIAPVRRVAGAERYATAAALAREAFPATTEFVYLASGEDYPDALAGTAAAAAEGAALLLTSRDALPSATRDALERLAPQRVTVLGGPAAVDDAVVDEVAARTGAAASRVAGEHRYATAASISEAVFDASSTVFFATGERFPDALVAAPAAARAGAPVLLTPTAGLHDLARGELARLKPHRAVLLGGPAALSEEVAASIRDSAENRE